MAHMSLLQRYCALFFAPKKLSKDPKRPASCTTYDDLNPFFNDLFRFKGTQHTSLPVINMYYSRLVSDILHC